MAYWQAKGAEKTMLNVGMPTYARGFTLSDASHTGIGASASGASPPGAHTGEAGFLSYYEVSFST